MNISFQRRTDLALGVLRALAAAPEVVAGADLADEVGTTVSYLPQVMAPLIKAGWVASDRGPGGGYRLTGAASDVRLLDVIEATEGPAADGRCVLRDAPCPGDEQCAVHVVWTEARRVLTEGFSAIAVIETTGGTT
ncbi:MAG: Rrf2 family transcriptional regulator [Acidimicrobiia bacterium]